MLTNHCLWCNQSIYINRSVMDIFFSNDCLCANCRQLLQPINKKISLWGYPAFVIYEYNKEVAAFLFQFKQMHDIELGHVFLPQNKIPLYRFIGLRTCVIVPSSLFSLQERGFYPLRILLKDMKIKLEEPFIKLSDEQKKLTLSKRKYVDIRLKDNKLRSKKVVLIDDVCASGSTLKACIRCLNKKGITDIKILLFALEKDKLNPQF